MREFLVYILYSRALGETYCGRTANLIARFKDHNELGNKGWVKNFRPWEVIHVETYFTRGEALEWEKYLKPGAGRDFIKCLIKRLD